MKSKPSWRRSGERRKLAERADAQVHSDSADARKTPDEASAGQPARGRELAGRELAGRELAGTEERRRQLLDLAAREEEVRLEATLDDELVAEIAAAYGIEFQDGFERALLCEAIKAERIWSEESVNESPSKSHADVRDSGILG